MIKSLRRILVVVFFLFIILALQQISSVSDSFYLGTNLVILGFLILTAYTFGELLESISLPPILGYLLVGISFGIFSRFIWSVDYFSFLNIKNIANYYLVEKASLAFIGLLAGFELSFIREKKVANQLFINLFSTFGLSILVSLAVSFVLFSLVFTEFSLSPNFFVPIGLLFSLALITNSIEVTFSAIKHFKQENSGELSSKIIFQSTVLRELLVITLCVLIIPYSYYLSSSPNQFDFNLLNNLSWYLNKTLFAGVALGVLIVAYSRFVKREQFLFTFAIIILGTELADKWVFELIVAFVICGVIVKKFARFDEENQQSLNKLFSVILVVSFLFFGARINFIANTSIWIIATAFFLGKILISFVSVKLTSTITKDKMSEKLWSSFLPSGILVLSIMPLLPAIVIVDNYTIKNIFSIYLLISFSFGSALQFIFLKKQSTLIKIAASEEEDISEIRSLELQKAKKIDKDNIIFNDPDFLDAQLNRSVYQIYFKLKEILQNFEKKFIYGRGEESLELVLRVTEVYTDEYNRLREFFTGGETSSIEISKQILRSKMNLIKVFSELTDERKQSEKGILKLESLITELYFSLSDLISGLKKEYYVEFEPSWFEIHKYDSFRVKVWKSIYKTKKIIGKLFNKNYLLKRTIDYRYIVKFHLIGETPKEILESVNLVGGERLTTLRKIRSLFTDFIANLDDFENSALNEKGNLALSSILLEQLEEIHNKLVNEINIFTNEINTTSDEIRDRLYYALALPYNRLVETLKISGTYEYNKKKFRYSKVFTNSEILKDTALQSIRYWVNYYLGFLGLFQKEIFISKLKVQLNQAITTSMINLADEINFNLRSIISSISSKKRDFVKELNKIENVDISTLESFLNIAKEKYFISTISSTIRNLDAIYKSKKYNLLIEDLIKSFNSISQSLPEKIYLLEERELILSKRVPVFLAPKELPFRNITNMLIEKKFPREIGEINEFLINYFNQMIQELKNIHTIVDFHFNTAIKELELKDNLSRTLSIDIIKTFLEKLNLRIEQLGDQIESFERTVNNKLYDKLKYFVDEINSQTLKFGKSEIERFFASDELSQIIKLDRNKILEIILKLKNGSVKFSKGIYEKINNGYKLHFEKAISGILISLGFKQSLQANSEKFSFNEDKLKPLPFIYRKLFDGTPLESIDFFIGRKEFESKFDLSYQSFLKQEWSSTFIIGESGSGKRSLVNNLRNYTLKGKEHHYIQFHSTITETNEIVGMIAESLGNNYQTSFEELVFQLNDKSKKEIILLEGMNKLFLRTVNGYNALRTLLTLISLTGRNTLWICTINKHAYRFLNSVFKLNNYFRYSIITEDIHRNDIKTIILSRHNATGYNVRYLSDDLSLLKEKIFRLKDSREDQMGIMNQYFRKLEDYSQGNIISAMYFWLQSIESVKENTVFIKPPGKIFLRELEGLTLTHLLTIANIFIHNSLTIEEHSKIFNMSEDSSTELLKHLSYLKIIREDNIEAYSNRFFMNKFIYKVVEKELLKQKLL